MRACTLVMTVVVLTAGWGRGQEVWPEKRWWAVAPGDVGMDARKLQALGKLVGGKGCVVRRGYMVYTWGNVQECGDVASAMEPVITALMLMAVQDGKIESVDEPIVKWEPRLAGLNERKNGAITWRHLASQTSGYGLAERPGEAWAYNDFALALYYDTLMGKVYGKSGTQVLKERLGDVLGFEDRYTFEVFGPKDRPGRLGISVRDFARFGLMYMRQGLWRDKQVLGKDLVRMAVGSPVRVDLPVTKGRDTEMLPKQRTIGGGKHITPQGPGQYSFNWWVNGKNKAGQMLHPNLPADAYVASGHGGMREMYVIPSWDVIVVWNDANIQEGDGKVLAATKLIREAVR